MNEVRERLERLRQSIRECESRFGRESDSVELVAVSKRQPAEAVREAFVAGQRDFGENYLKEAKFKIEALAEPDIRWHFIGAIQSNKTAEIAALFDWVHTVDRDKIARRLSEQRPAELGPLNVCIQVNISGERTKNGIGPDNLSALIETISGLPRLNLRGLMALPAPESLFERQRENFASLRGLVKASAESLDHLSIGTSGDYEAAIAEGSTMVRIGTALFGPRD